MSKPLSKKEYNQYVHKPQFPKVWKFLGSAMAGALNVLILMLLAWLIIATFKGMLWTIRWVI